MKVSALVPTFNRRQYVLRSIESILSQTAPVDEIIVVDDGSTDGTAEAIKSQFGDQVRLICQKNTGVSGARLRAIKEARGEWVAFLDSDDVWPTDRNDRFLKAIVELPSEVAWVFGDIIFVTDQGEEPSFFSTNGLSMSEQPKVFPDSLSAVYPVLYSYLQASLIRRDALLDCDCFRSGLRSDEDWLASIQVACRYSFAALPMIAAKISRTSDLAASSLFHQRRSGLNRDRLRARRMMFSFLAATKQKGPWGEHFASETRELCKLEASEGKSFRRLALEQFRYSVSPKGIVFLFAVMFGRPGIRLWESLRGRIVENRV